MEDWGRGGGVEREGKQQESEWTQFSVAFSGFPEGMSGTLCLAIEDKRGSIFWLCGLYCFYPLSFDG